MEAAAHDKLRHTAEAERIQREAAAREAQRDALHKEALLQHGLRAEEKRKRAAETE